jgi:hypothetical protein
MNVRRGRLALIMQQFPELVKYFHKIRLFFFVPAQQSSGGGVFFCRTLLTGAPRGAIIYEH